MLSAETASELGIINANRQGTGNRQDAGMVKRRHIAAVPGFVFGAAPFQQDVRSQLMYFGLTGEELGF